MMMMIIKVVVVLLMLQVALAKANPCDISNGSKKSGRIQFRQDLQPGTQLFTLPFIGNKIQIKDVTIKSNEDVISGYFKLDFKTLILDKEFDLDNIKIDFIELLFTCTSALTPFSNTFLLYITVIDINNYAPEFVGVPYEFQVKELTPTGTVVYRKIKAVDRDLPNRPNSQISYSIIPGPYSEYFEFALSTHSELSIAKQINYDTFQKCELTIKAEDHGMPPKSTLTKIKVQIIDTDDKDPVFSKTSYTGFLSHNSVPGSFVNMTEEILAFDQDTGINTTLAYSIDTNSQDGLFDINPADGRIFLKTRIPKGFKNGYNLIVKASQVNNPARSNLATVTINVVNINEHLPKFDHGLYEASIREDAFYNTPLVTVHATDNDDNPIEYLMITNNDNPFMIDPKSGTIKLNRKLDYEIQSAYTLEVAAKDGKHSSSALVIVKVLNVVDQAPRFEQVYYNFKIKSPNDIYIGQVRALDSENTGYLKYTLEFATPSDSSLFCISNIGAIYICPQDITETYSVEANGEKVTGHVFTRNEYKFHVHASIPVNETSEELVSKVECRIDVEFKILSESPILSISGRELLFKDSNTFFAFLAAISGITVVMVTSLIVIIWFKCQRRKRKLPALYNGSSNGSKSVNNTISSEESARASSVGSSQASYKNGLRKVNPNTQIINQWDEKGINSIFYGGDEQAPEEEKRVDAENLRSFELSELKKPDTAEQQSATTEKRPKSKASSRSISSSSSTSVPISSLGSTRTPSFSSIGISLAVDNTISEAVVYSFPKEPLSINYETNLETSTAIQQPLYKSEFTVVPRMHNNYTSAGDDSNASMSVDMSHEEHQQQQTVDYEYDIRETLRTSDQYSYFHEHYHHHSTVQQQQAEVICSDYSRIAYV